MGASGPDLTSPYYDVSDLSHNILVTLKLIHSKSLEIQMRGISNP